MRDIRLHNICRLKLKQFAVLMWRVQALAVATGMPSGATACATFCRARRILGRNRFLDPTRAERCKGISYRDRGHRVEPSVHFNEDFCIDQQLT